MTTPLIAEFDALVARQWAELAAPGVWWTGAERVAIAAAARGARDSDLPAPAMEAAHRIAVEAHTIRPVDIARWADSRLPVEAYVELVGIVCRIAALDGASFGLGLDEQVLPRPIDGGPSLWRPEHIEITNGWVPTDGPCFPPTALSVVPGATEALFDVHDFFYLSVDDMGDNEIERDGISRPQMELVAARTSFLNECFY